MMTERRSRLGVERIRRPAFYAAVVAALALYVALMRDLLPLVVTAWFVDVGAHRVHDLNFLALVWIGILGLVVQLYRPEDRVTAVVFPLLVMGPLAAMAATTGSPITTMPVVFAVVGVVVAALHPAGRALLRVERVDPVDRGLVGLVAVATVPLLAYAGDQLARQYAAADEHAALVHYGGMALVAVLILLMAGLSAVRRRDWRFAAWAAGALSVYLGASSVAFPGLAGSAAPAWGGAAVAWGVAFVASAEVARRDRKPVRIEVETEIDAPPEGVWEFVNDFDRMTEWVVFADELTYLSDGAVGEGTVYREYGGVGPTKGESEWEIVEFDPPRRQVHAGDLGIMRPTLTMELDAAGGGTRFRQVIEFRVLPAVRPIGWLLETLVVRRAMRNGLRETQANLKELIESGE